MAGWERAEPEGHVAARNAQLHPLIDDKKPKMEMRRRRTAPGAAAACTLLLALPGIARAFTSPPPRRHVGGCSSASCPSSPSSPRVSTSSLSAGGEGGEAEWVKALLDAGGGNQPGKFEEEMKMKGLLGPNRGKGNTKLSANARLIAWLEEEGGVYLAESSTWGEAPHPLAISTETVDEITNESSGRGLLARRSVNDGDELLKIPLDLCLTRKSARRELGKDALQGGINEYLAIACQLIHEKFVKGED